MKASVLTDEESERLVLVSAELVDIHRATKESPSFNMAWLILLVLSIFVTTAVRGEVFEDFNKCNHFFFKGRPVLGLENIALKTPTPLDGTSISKEELRKEYIKVYKSIYNLLHNVEYEADLNACPLKKTNEITTTLQDLKSKIDRVQVEFNDIRLDEVTQLCQGLLSEIPTVSECPRLKDKLKTIIKTLNEVKTKTQNVTPVPENPPELSKVCLSVYEAPSPAFICQKYGNNPGDNYHFATMYDRGRRIPLYSAYRMDRSGTVKRTGDIVNYEPQLVHQDPGESKQKPIREINTFITQYNTRNNCPGKYDAFRIAYKLRWSQATDDDFITFDRGHLNPAGHHADGDGSTATMTHTNVAPQNIKLNQNAWNDYETKLRLKYGSGLKSVNDNNERERLKVNRQQDCANLYVVTGVVPGNQWQFGRVNIPSYYWSAHCCTTKEPNMEEVPVLSGGAVCSNTDDGTLEEFDSVEKLEEKLKTLIENELNLKLNTPIKIFYECVPQITQGKPLSLIPDSKIPLKPRIS